MSRARPAADRRGFTLVELLLALLLTGLVAVSIFEVISGESRFVELQSAREEVQQNSRAALELIGSELRTVPAGNALVQAYADSITFRTSRVWGVVCAVGGPTSLDVALPAIAGASYPINLGTGVVVNLGTRTAPVWSNSVGLTGVGAAATTCGGSNLAAGIERRTLTLSATPLSGTTTATVGNVLYIHDQVTYRSGSSAGVPGTWIQRRSGEGVGSANQPLAGPIEENGNGLRFLYYAGASSAPIATPITDANVRRTVNRIAVIVDAVSRNSLDGTRQSKADTIIVSLRNRS